MISPFYFEPSTFSSSFLDFGLSLTPNGQSPTALLLLDGTGRPRMQIKLTSLSERGWIELLQGPLWTKVEGYARWAGLNDRTEGGTQRGDDKWHSWKRLRYAQTVNIRERVIPKGLTSLLMQDPILCGYASAFYVAEPLPNIRYQRPDHGAAFPYVLYSHSESNLMVHFLKFFSCATYTQGVLPLKKNTLPLVEKGSREKTPGELSNSVHHALLFLT
ncbi:hypothetical protein VNO77_44229 [Canavalia gladiata]|uniref:Uncharacterized protein n=1 Tax=Canavalia gladiata TaxID=3824 RepID=A0AAN9JY57_CANGL